MTARPSISAVVPVLNEAPNLEYLLPTVTWCDEILVIDQGSSDRSLEVARRHGARVVEVDWQPAFDANRELGAARAAGEWIFQLDADEMVPLALAQRLRELSRRADLDIVAIPRCNYFLGPLTTGGLWPDTQYRFYRRNSIELTAEVHSFYKLRSERVLHLPPKTELAIHHFQYRGASPLLQKLDRYTDLELRKMDGRSDPPGIREFVWAPLRVFLSRYLRHGAWRSGWRGVWLSVFWTFYFFVCAVKSWERHHLPTISRAEDERKREILGQHDR